MDFQDVEDASFLFKMISGVNYLSKGITTFKI